MLRVWVAAVALLTLAGLCAAGGSARTSWDRCTARKGDVRFRAADGTRLAGHVYGRGASAVVLAHQSPGDMCQWTGFAKRLSQRGYRTLVFDFRNYGASQKRSSPRVRYALDVAAGAKLLRSRGARKVFLVGASFGGSAVLTAATVARPLVDGVVSVSGAADLAGAIDAVPRLQAPALFLVGRYDTDFAGDAQRLYDAAGSTDKTLKVLDRGEHGTDLVASSLTARRLIFGFFAAH